MTGGAAPRRKGDSFERRVKRVLNANGFFAIRQPRSAFPDVVAARKKGNIPELFFIECKTCKYISSQEREDLINLAIGFAGTSLIAYKGQDKKIYFCDLNYKDIVLYA